MRFLFKIRFRLFIRSLARKGIGGELPFTVYRFRYRLKFRVSLELGTKDEGFNRLLVMGYRMLTTKTGTIFLTTDCTDCTD